MDLTRSRLTPEEADELLAEAVLTDEGRQDPYPTYRALREGIGRWRSSTGSMILTSYGDGLEVLRNPRLGRPEPDMERPLTIARRSQREFGEVQSMLMLNPPDHTRIRSLVSRAFTPGRVAALRPNIVSTLEPVLDRFREQGGGDLIEDVASVFPIAVISEMLGVPHSLAPQVQPLVRAITALIDSAATDDDVAAGEEAVGELSVIFDELIGHKRSSPDEGLLSALIEVEESGDRLSHEELIANTILLYSAGFETTGNLIGNGMLLLLSNPDQMHALRKDPTLIPSAIMEMLRADSPVQLNVRTALEPVEIFGETHDRGATFVVLQGSGNHDGAVYADAEEFDVSRFVSPDTATPLSFGWGAHHCLGAHLARAEGEIFFSRMLQTSVTIELNGDSSLAPRFRSSFTLRGLDNLEIAIS